MSDATQDKTRKEQMILWAKVLGVVVLILEGVFSSWKATKAADSSTVKEISQEIYSTGEEALTKASVNEANIKVCFDQLNLLRTEMNDKSLKFAELVVQLAQTTNPRYREVRVSSGAPRVSLGAPPSGRIAGAHPHTPAPAPVELPPAAANLQQQIDSLAPSAVVPLDPKTDSPTPMKNERIQRLYDSL